MNSLKIFIPINDSIHWETQESTIMTYHLLYLYRTTTPVEGFYNTDKHMVVTNNNYAMVT